MSQMPQLAACPSCEEPLESGDRFCGACGYDLSAVPAPPDDHPTITMNGSAPRPPSAAAGAAPVAPVTAVDWPVAPEADSSGTPAAVVLPADIEGRESGGSDSPGVRFDRPAGSPAPPHAQSSALPPERSQPPSPAQPPARPQGQAQEQEQAQGQPQGHVQPSAHTAAPGSAALGPVAPGPAPASAHGSAPGMAHGSASGSGEASSHAAGHAPGQAPASGSAPASAHGSASGSGEASSHAPGHAPTSAPAAHAAAEPDEYPLAAPLPPEIPADELPTVEVPTLDAPLTDPRTADLATPAAGLKVCVACRAGQVDRDGYCENCGHAQPRERDHMEQELDAVAAVSDRGLRHHRNEDAFTVSATALPDGSPAVVAIVCDGVSSATRPDEASLAASRAANESMLAALPCGTHPQQAMHDAILAAAEAVNSLADPATSAHDHQPHVNAPACTLVGAVVTPTLLVVGWVGDSRVYWVPVDRSAPPARLTEDDSWAAQMVAAGLMNEAEAYADERAHAITGWLGADAYELEPHTASFKPDRPGVVVVCTDGLWNYAEGAEEMAEVVPPDAADRPLHSAQVLVGHALDGGGHDNVTVAVLPFPAPQQGAGSA
ncbi:protein phosphatase 2C domain-containing protein [Streptomyces sp. LRE541]|nr:PP2C family serine/threonine-protein phosphatase [Streptomyces sp. LRE541]UPZ31169.1 protein phosphatase 2C domain-containing protein [Streptomyces sp. LRE541]